MQRMTVGSVERRPSMTVVSWWNLHSKVHTSTDVTGWHNITTRPDSSKDLALYKPFTYLLTYLLTWNSKDYSLKCVWKTCQLIFLLYVCEMWTDFNKRNGRHVLKETLNKCPFHLKYVPALPREIWGDDLSRQCSTLMYCTLKIFETVTMPVVIYGYSMIH